VGDEGGGATLGGGAPLWGRQDEAVSLKSALDYFRTIRSHTHAPLGLARSPAVLSDRWTRGFNPLPKNHRRAAELNKNPRGKMS
jgi:hypothetical protein